MPSHSDVRFPLQVVASLTTFWQDADGIIGFARFAGLTYPVKNNSPYYTEQWAAKVRHQQCNRALRVRSAH